MKDISSASKRFFSGTLISRITGMLRDISMAAVFGSSPFIAGFMVAFRLSNLLRRVLGEGALQAAFIPHYQKLQLDHENRGIRFFLSLKKILGRVLVSIVVITEIILLIILNYKLASPDSLEIIKLTAIMFPGIIFICFYGINMSFLQCHNHYFIGSIAPAIFNITWIIAVILLRKTNPYSAVTVLSYTVILAFALQWLITAIQSYKKTAYLPKFKLSTRNFLSENSVFLKALSLGIIGVAAVQVNSACDAIFATIADVRGPAYLWYAIRIQQLPLALISISITASLLPTIAHSVKSGNKDDFQDLFNKGLNKNLSLMIPITFGLILIGPALNGIIYGHGAFEQQTWITTTQCLWAYNIGLLPAALVGLFSVVLYSQGNYRLPAITSIVTVLLNLSLNYILIFWFQWGAISIALATAISSWCNATILGLAVKRRGLEPIFRKNLHSSMRTIICCIIGLISTSTIFFYITGNLTWLNLLLNKDPDPSYYNQIYHILELLSLGVIFTSILIGAAKILKHRPLSSIKNIINF